jgi:hypothetical protein
MFLQRLQTEESKTECADRLKKLNRHIGQKIENVKKLQKKK